MAVGFWPLGKDGAGQGVGAISEAAVVALRVTRGIGGGVAEWGLAPRAAERGERKFPEAHGRKITGNGSWKDVTRGTSEGDGSGDHR